MFSRRFTQAFTKHTEIIIVLYQKRWVLEVENNNLFILSQDS